ncbi:hypothetical protein A2311_03310 [candidate division WOR-1 bacterium RIFOXYB2_FULL_48_7]|uniref:Uncharacterized protein n=1 Tax=candidate division WOR-1 bacterium RIFOXYB2_FULL_48_7 TaxID=1802583 RepID=A0A1F4TVB0_UNCSA|nr:MAG: hypothetical protein A2311_03310 [candidate division WOR-1 bacterium RIFOXYB2_FULL_48_7]
MALNVSIKGLIFRASDRRLNAEGQLRILLQRLSGPAGIARIRAGDNQEALSGYQALRQPATETEIELINMSTVTAVQVKALEVPEMIDDPRLPFKVSRGVVTGGQIAWLVKAGYMITGCEADRLNAAIADESNAAKGVGYCTLLDGRALAEELNRQNPGRKFRVPSEPELIKLNNLVGKQLSGTNFWIWTETQNKRYPGTFVLCLLDSGLRNNDYPDFRNYYFAVRLVEDK